MPTTSATGRDRRSPTRPETGRGHASLWTAAAAPDHRLWTTLRGPLDPSRLPTCPLPLRRRRASRYLSITPIKRRDDLTTYATAPVAETALVNIDGPQTGGPFPSIEVGHTGLSKARDFITRTSIGRSAGWCALPDSTFNPVPAGRAFTTSATPSRSTPWSSGIGPAWTWPPVCLSCRPISATRHRPGRTGTCPRRPNCWPWRPRAWIRT